MQTIQTTDLFSLPYSVDRVSPRKETIDSVVNELIKTSKEDWDSYETSWDFIEHPFFLPKIGFKG